MMRVLFLGNLYPAPWDPTRGTFNLNTVRALADHAEVRVVSPWGWWTRARRPGEWFHPPSLTAEGVEATYPTYWSVPAVSLCHGRLMAASLRAHLARIRAEFPFDVILAAFAYPDGVAAEHLSRAFDVPYVVAVLGSDINTFPNSRTLRGQIVRSLRRAGRIVSVSQALKEKTAELGVEPQRIVVQYNGVEGDRFEPREKEELRRQLGLPLDRKVICYVGNFKPEKGVDVLVQAMDDLRAIRQRPGRGSSGPDFELAMVGSGVMQQELDTIVRERGLQDVVRFHGRQPHAKVPDWIGACDVFCLPSRREGCPNVVLEALASGRPVVGSAVGGVPELLAKDNGVLAPAGDPRALAGALHEALERPWDPAALRASVPCLSWAEVGLTYRDVLTSAIREWPIADKRANSLGEEKKQDGEALSIER
jgi:glycosyltransferase involved in cell wall biosynthesis